MRISGFDELEALEFVVNTRSPFIRLLCLRDIAAVPIQNDIFLAQQDLGYGHVEQLFGVIFAYLGQHKVAPVGPPNTIYHDPEFREQDVDVEVVVPVAGLVSEGEKVKGPELPGGEMACVVHQGGYDTIGGTYGQVMSWIEANDYCIAGPPREVYLKGPESGDDPSTYVTEIRVPVTKAGCVKGET